MISDFGLALTGLGAFLAPKPKATPWAVSLRPLGAINRKWLQHLAESVARYRVALRLVCLTSEPILVRKPIDG